MIDQAPNTSKKNNPWLNILLQVVLAVTISLLCITAYDRYRYRTVMTVDVDAVMQNKLNQLKNEALDLEQEKMIQLSQTWARQLDQEVQRLSTQYNAVIFVRPAVIEGSIDMTSHVINKLNRSSGQNQ